MMLAFPGASLFPCCVAPVFCPPACYFPEYNSAFNMSSDFYQGAALNMGCTARALAASETA